MNPLNALDYSRLPDYSRLKGMDDLGGDVYVRWVRIAILVVLVGYGLTTVADLLVFEAQGRSWALVTKGGTMAAAVAALYLVSHGRARLAAGLTLGAVWLELHAALPLSGLDASSLIVLPVLVSAGGMLVGGRAGYVMAGVTAVTVPAFALIGTLVRGDQVALSPGATYLWVITSVCMFAAAALVQLGLESFARVLTGARASEDRMANLQRHAPDGMVATDEDGRIVSLNPRAEALLAAPGASLIGRPLREAFATVCDEDDAPDRWLDPSSDAFAATQTLRMRDGSGARLLIEAQSTPVPWADGSVGHQLTLRDVTEQERAAANERILRAQLEHSQRLEAVGRLAGGVAHEFNNLLTVVGGAAELLLVDSKGPAAELAAEILAAKVRGATLTKQLLAFARKDLVQPRRLSLTAVVGELEPLLCRFVSENVRLRLDLTAETAAVVADQAQVEQVLVNLVVNARDAIRGRGDVTVGVAAGGAERSFRERTWVVPRETVELWVEDTGSGMDEETRAHLFEPFFTTKPRGDGTGLGLAMVHGIVSQNGGSLEVLSEPDHGTVFLVRWPVSPGA
jgi:PAS domain S-box-containing protein